MKRAILQGVTSKRKGKGNKNLERASIREYQPGGSKVTESDKVCSKRGRNGKASMKK